MSEEIRLNGIGVAPGVLDTMVTLAAESVDGVDGICGAKLPRMVSKGQAKGVSIDVTEDGAITVAVHVSVTYGRPVREIGHDVQAAVADALTSQTGDRAVCVDVFVDGVSFEA